jgi:hypothetical protein
MPKIEYPGYDLAKICLKAARILDRDGLKKGGFGFTKGPKCAMGAVRVAVHGKNIAIPNGLYQTIAVDLFRAARPRRDDPDLIFFNDSDRTRKRDVVAALRAMARVAKRG